MTDYEYDVFVSYQRGSSDGPGGTEVLSKDGEWVQDVFYPELKRCLDQERSHFEPFIDEEIQVGARWPDKLKTALHRSRIMLAVWSVPYFESPWCRSEWHSMLEREKYIQTKQNTSMQLVYPVVFWDGKFFDEEAKRTQCKKDMKRFSSLRKENEGTDLHLEFRIAMQDLCSDLCNFAESAPTWDPKWPLIEMEGLKPRPIPLARNG